jgi:SRSO17 transposase
MAADVISEVRLRGVQHLLNVVGRLGREKSGALVPNQTGFLKKGENSGGVARQHIRTAGKEIRKVGYSSATPLRK